MTEIDEIKKIALEKLDDFVREELKYLKASGMTLSSFDINNMLDDALSDREKKELKGSIEQIKKNSVRFYCRCRGIEIPAEVEE